VKMPLLNLGDIQIYYEERGSGEAVLLAPPSQALRHVERGVVPFLSQRYRRLFSIAAARATVQPDHGYTISQFAEDCAGP
jgi:hypothetical protein